MFSVPTIWLVIALALIPGDFGARLATTAPISLSGQTPPPVHTQVGVKEVPVQTETDLPALSAPQAYAIDIDTGTVLYQKDATTEKPIASITKLATVITFLRDRNLSDVVTIPQLPAYGPADEIIGLKPGEEYTIRNLVAATLIKSANDAADSLAIIDSGSKEAFASKMSKRLQEWGIEDTQFTNPSGLTTSGALNTASAQAVAQMGMLAIRKPEIAQMVATPQQAITSTQGRTLSLTTTNQLLQNGSFTGIKTGYTPEAGQCFVGLTTIQGHRVVTVVLGSSDRFGETTQLRNWIDRTYQWQ